MSAFKISDELQTKNSKIGQDSIPNIYRVLALEYFNAELCYVCKASVKLNSESIDTNVTLIPVRLEDDFGLYSVEGEKAC